MTEKGGGEADPQRSNDPTQAYPIDRRTILQTTGTGLAGVAGLSETTTAQTTSGGDLVWEFETDDWVWSSPTIVNGTVYFSSYDETLYAVDVESGNEEWTLDLPRALISSPTVVGGVVYIGSDDKNVYAVDAGSGKEEWAFETDNRVWSSPTVADETVYVGSDALYAVDTKSGENRWAFSPGQYAESSPTVLDGTIFIGNMDHNLYAVDAESGQEKWRFEADDGVCSPTVVDGTVFVGSYDNNLYAVDSESGNKKWTFETGGQVRSSPTVVDGTVFVGSYDNNLYAVDSETGNKKWTFKTGGRVHSSPTVVDGTVFVGSHDNNLYAVDSESGNKKWTFNTSDTITSSPTVVDGTVFVGSQSNSLYAVDGGVEGSSNGSRVNLGTLGHHHVFAENGATLPGESGGSELEAAFIMSPEEPSLKQPITFDASDSEATGTEITEYRWDFTDDGETDTTGTVVEHTFDDQGNYDVTLTIVGEDGTKASTTKSLELSGFDPAIHGFGFINWSGTAGPTFSGHDHQSIIESEFQTQFNQEWLPIINAASWVSLPTVVGKKLAGAIYQTFSEAPDSVFSDGHCYGMCLVAQNYYENGIPDTLDEEVESAADITKPTDEYSPVGRAIDRQHRSQFLDSTTLEQLPYLSPNQSYEVTSIDIKKELQAIQSVINQQGTALVGVGQHPSTTSATTTLAHQLVGYNIRFKNTDSLSKADIAYIDVYDPNHPNGDPQQTLKIDISLGNEMPIINNESSGYRNIYQRFALIGESRPDFTGKALFTRRIILDILDNYLEGYIEIVANSPVRINAVAPDGQELVHPEAPVDDTPPSEYVYLTNPPAGEYEIKIEGTDDGSYAIDVKGSTINGGIIENSINGSVTEGEIQTATATIPETEGEEGGVSEPVSGGSDEPGVADYAGDNDVVETPGLLNAISDWRDDKINTTLLLDVIEAWRSGDPVS